MNLDITEKYFASKKKNILDYVLCMSKIIITKPLYWNNKEEFTKLVKPIVDECIDNFYFKDKLIENRKEKISLEEVSNFVPNDKKDYLGLIVYLAINLDYYNCALLNKINLKEYLNKRLNFITDYKINKKYFDNLFNKLKNNYKKDIDFFEEFKSITLNNSFYCLSTKNNYFLVTYEFQIEELNNYKELDINYILNNNNYLDEIFNLSLNYINLTILKEILVYGTSDTFFIKFPIKYFSKKTNIEKFNKMFSSKYMKSKVRFLIYQDEVKECTKQINLLRQKDIKTMMSNKIDVEKLKLYKDIDLMNRRER